MMSANVNTDINDGYTGKISGSLTYLSIVSGAIVLLMLIIAVA